jgi:protease-4
MNRTCKWLVTLALTIAASLLASAPVRAADEKSDKKETKETSAARPIVAVIRLNAPIVETPVNESLPFGETRQPLSLKDLTARLAKARDDQAVKAVVILLESSTFGAAQAEEIRQAIAEVSKSGKDVYVHADGLNSIKDYAMLSPATHLGVVPTGDLWLTGLYGESMYLRGLLKKLGVTPDFLTCGEYKSAAETFMREGPSPKAEEMQNWLLDSMFETQLKLIAKGRGVEVDKVKKWIDDGPYTAQKAKDLGIIDAVEQRQDMEARLKARFGEQVKFDHKYGVKAGPHADLSSPLGVFEFYSELLGTKKKKTYKTSVAIVYVDGAITLGETEASPFSGGSEGAGSSKLRRALDEAAADETIKAVVLRVNSPGGSATASDIILDATRRVKAKKPLVVSMGDVAASGGYYVSCASDTVFADEATITGSIGVVGGKMATTDMWNKVGISFKGYKRGAHADMLSSSHVFTAEERTHVQAWMDEIYGVFKGHVTASRGKKLKKPIDELAGGRVYSGRQALELGLVDKIGTLDDAVKFAASEAKLDKYELRVVPEPKGFFEMLLEGSGEDKTSDKRLGARSPAQDSPLLQAALPLLRQLDPQRLAAVRMALLRLDLLQRDGVVLMAPEIIVGAK